MNDDRRNLNVSKYFGMSPQQPGGGTSYSRNNAQFQQSTERPNQGSNEKHGIHLMTVTRKPNNQNNIVANRTIPKPTIQFQGIVNINSNSSRQNMEIDNLNSAKKKNMDTTEDISQPQLSSQEKVRFLTGTIEKVMKWHRIMKDFCYYEVIGPVVSIQEGKIPMQKVMLLRDKKGPVLKIIHFIFDRIQLPNFHIGQVIRCVGRMICPNTLQVFTITEATEEEISCLPRLTAKCDQVVAIYQLDNN